MTVDYKDNLDLRILTRIFRGEVTVDDTISSWQHVLDNDLVTENHIGVITDYKGADLQAQRKDLEALKIFFSENINIFKSLKLAQIIDTPDIANAILFVSEYSEINSQAFSTMGSAIEWVLEQ